MPANNYESLKKATRELTQKDIVAKFGPGPYKLNLGCGSDLKKGYINIDSLDLGDNPDTDQRFLQLDLEVGRLPFLKGSVDEIFAAHIMEHLYEFPKLMNECHRVLKNSGTLKVYTPCYPAVEVFQDPTHVRVFTQKTFQYFLQDSFLFKHVGASYGYLPWSRLNQTVANGWELQATLIK